MTYFLLTIFIFYLFNACGLPKYKDGSWQRKNRVGVKRQRKVKVVIGRRKTQWSHNKWGFLIHVNNVANVDSWKPKATETWRNTTRGGENKNNLVIIQPSWKAPDVEICISLLNTQSCRNKASEVKDFILDNHIDVLALTETWLKTSDSDRVTRSEVTPPGYQLLDVPKPKGRGGRVGLITKDTIHVKKQNIPVVTSSYECMEVLLNAGSCFVRLLIIYRPPSSNKLGLYSSVFLE